MEKRKAWNENLKEFWNEEDGGSIVEVVLILAVLVALVLIFKTQVKKLVDDAFTKIGEDKEDIFKK